MGSRITAAACLLAYLLVLTFFDEKRCTQKRVISWLVLSSSSSCPHWSLQSSPPLSMLQGHQSQDFCHCLDQMHDSQMGFRIISSSEQGGTARSPRLPHTLHKRASASARSPR